jgi:hypothetical protein
VDSRYMLWNMAEVDGAANLLEEMGIIPSTSARSAVPAPKVRIGSTAKGSQ